MHIEFDTHKNDTNILDRGLSFERVVNFEFETAVFKQDTRRDYGESRQIGYAIAGDRLYCVVFVDRPPDMPTERRIISLRKANSREVRNYETNR